MEQAPATKSPRDKIIPVEELPALLAPHRERGEKIVHCHGVFDLLHIGHIRYFEQAERFGDMLVVTITPDRFVDKGPHRPAFPEALRAEAVASLGSVDYVAINQWPTAEETLRLIRPDFYVKGAEFKGISTDMTGKIGREAEVVREIGATLAFAEDIVFSSSNLINRYLSDYPNEVQEYLNLFRNRYTLDDVNAFMDKMESLNVLVIGDVILDEYQYCEAIGKSSKDPIIALKYQSHDLFAGGVLAVANHVANFAGRVTVASVIGERDSYTDFIIKSLNPNVSPHFMVQPNAPTIIKRRFVDGYTFNKLFEVYVIDEKGLPPEKEDELCAWLKAHLRDYDLVIASDFGHGAIGEQTVRALCEHARFLAINTQANAGNRGFHTVTRYPRADFVCIAEHEIRLETRDLKTEASTLMTDIAERLKCGRLVVTRGRKGCLILDRDGDCIEVPSFALKTVDRVGAGDAFLSVTSLAAALGVPQEMLGFIGNVVGSLAVGILGNQKAIDKLSVKKFMTSLMK